MRRQQNDLAIGAKLPQHLAPAGLEVIDFQGRYDIHHLRDIETAGGGAARAARGAILAAGLASEEDARRWDRAAERRFAEREGKHVCIGIFLAIGRKSA